MLYYISQNPKIDSPAISNCGIEVLLDWVKDKKVIEVDSETTGDFNFQNKIILLQIGDYNNQFVIDTTTVSPLPLKSVLENKDVVKIFHNFKFDTKFLRFCYGIQCVNIYDTFLAECLITNGHRPRNLGLADVVSKYCGAYLDKSVRETFVGKKDNAFSEAEIVYSGRDVTFLGLVRDKQLEVLKELDLMSAANLEMEVVHTIAEFEYNGMGLDSKRWLDQAYRMEDLLATKMLELDSFTLSKYPKNSFKVKTVQVSLFPDEHSRDLKINWDSPIQVKQLFNECGMDFDSVSAVELEIHGKSNELVAKYLEYKKVAKLVSTYGKSFLNYINPVTSRIHSNFWQILDTARMSSGGSDICPNIQNLPATPEYREPFIPRKGFKIVSIDFSAEEARLAAFGSKEPGWINPFIDGKDLHSEVAAMIFKIDPNKSTDTPEFLKGKSYRTVAKTINFALLYGASEFKISKSLSIEVEEAKKLLDSYFSAVPKLQGYLQKCVDYGMENGYIRSYKPVSYIRYLSGWYPGLSEHTDKKLYGRLKRICYNTPIQTTGAAILKEALVKIRNYIIDNKLESDVKFFAAVHDQIDMEVRESFAEEWSIIQKNLMEEVEQVYLGKVPAKVDIKISDCWKK
jgi:DNA polymerase I-like protein with 3'-5' exonuclease and polymerase domains